MNVKFLPKVLWDTNQSAIYTAAVGWISTHIFGVRVIVLNNRFKWVVHDGDRTHIHEHRVLSECANLTHSSWNISTQEKLYFNFRLLHCSTSPRESFDNISHTTNSFCILNLCLNITLSSRITKLRCIRYVIVSTWCIVTFWHCVFLTDLVCFLALIFHDKWQR